MRKINKKRKKNSFDRPNQTIHTIHANHLHTKNKPKQVKDCRKNQHINLSTYGHFLFNVHSIIIHILLYPPTTPAPKKNGSSSFFWPLKMKI